MGRKKRKSVKKGVAEGLSEVVAKDPLPVTRRGAKNKSVDQKIAEQLSSSTHGNNEVASSSLPAVKNDENQRSGFYKPESEWKKDENSPPSSVTTATTRKSTRLQLKRQPVTTPSPSQQPQIPKRTRRSRNNNKASPQPLTLELLNSSDVVRVKEEVLSDQDDGGGAAVTTQQEQQQPVATSSGFNMISIKQEPIDDYEVGGGSGGNEVGGSNAAAVMFAPAVGIPVIKQEYVEEDSYYGDSGGLYPSGGVVMCMQPQGAAGGGESGQLVVASGSNGGSYSNAELVSLSESYRTHSNHLKMLQKKLEASKEFVSTLQNENQSLQSSVQKFQEIAEKEKSRAEEAWKQLDMTKLYNRTCEEGAEQRFNLNQKYSEAVELIRAKASERLREIEADRGKLASENEALVKRVGVLEQRLRKRKGKNKEGKKMQRFGVVCGLVRVLFKVLGAVKGGNGSGFDEFFMRGLIDSMELENSGVRDMLRECLLEDGGRRVGGGDREEDADDDDRIVDAVVRELKWRKERDGAGDGDETAHDPVQLVHEEAGYPHHDDVVVKTDDEDEDFIDVEGDTNDRLPFQQDQKLSEMNTSDEKMEESLLFDDHQRTYLEDFVVEQQQQNLIAEEKLSLLPDVDVVALGDNNEEEKNKSVVIGDLMNEMVGYWGSPCDDGMIVGLEEEVAGAIGANSAVAIGDVGVAVGDDDEKKSLLLLGETEQQEQPVLPKVDVAMGDGNDDQDVFKGLQEICDVMVVGEEEQMNEVVAVGDIINQQQEGGETVAIPPPQPPPDDHEKNDIAVATSNKPEAAAAEAEIIDPEMLRLVGDGVELIDGVLVVTKWDSDADERKTPPLVNLTQLEEEKREWRNRGSGRGGQRGVKRGWEGDRNERGQQQQQTDYYRQQQTNEWGNNDHRHGNSDYYWGNNSCDNRNRRHGDHSWSGRDDDWGTSNTNAHHHANNNAGSWGTIPNDNNNAHRHGKKTTQQQQKKKQKTDHHNNRLMTDLFGDDGENKNEAKEKNRGVHGNKLMTDLFGDAHDENRSHGGEDFDFGAYGASGEDSSSSSSCDGDGKSLMKSVYDEIDKDLECDDEEGPASPDDDDTGKVVAVGTLAVGDLFVGGGAKKKEQQQQQKRDKSLYNQIAELIDIPTDILFSKETGPELVRNRLGNHSNNLPAIANVIVNDIVMRVVRGFKKIELSRDPLHDVPLTPKFIGVVGVLRCLHDNNASFSMANEVMRLIGEAFSKEVGGCGTSTKRFINEEGVVQVGRFVGALVKHFSVVGAVDSLVVKVFGVAGPYAYSFLFGVLCSESVGVLNVVAGVTKWNHLALWVKFVLFFVLRCAKWGESKFRGCLVGLLRSVGVGDGFVDGGTVAYSNLDEFFFGEIFGYFCGSGMVFEGGSPSAIGLVKSVVGAVVCMLGGGWVRSNFGRFIERLFSGAITNDLSVSVLLEGFGLGISWMKHEDLLDSTGLELVKAGYAKISVDLQYPETIRASANTVISTLLGNIRVKAVAGAVSYWRYLRRNVSGGDGGNKKNWNNNKKKSAEKRKRQNAKRREKKRMGGDPAAAVAMTSQQRMSGPPATVTTQQQHPQAMPMMMRNNPATSSSTAAGSSSSHDNNTNRYYNNSLNKSGGGGNASFWKRGAN